MMKNNQIIGMYLAAGNSRRMGSNKLLLPLRHLPLGSHALASALSSNLDHIYVITKEQDQLAWLHPSLFIKQQKWTHFICQESNNGQSESIKFGIKKAIEHGACAVMVMLADQPFITVKMINQLIHVFRNNHDYNYVASSFQGIIRPPILFSAPFFSQIQKLQGDEGARRLLRHTSTNQEKIIPFHDEKMFLDVDTMEDYKSVLGIADEKDK